MENRIRRGEVYFVFLDPCFGREAGGFKARPVVVVSADDIHQRTRMVAVVPGTTTDLQGRNFVRVDAQPGRGADRGNGLREPTHFACHQIRAIDQGRMTGPPAGRLSETDFERILDGVRHTLGLHDIP